MVMTVGQRCGWSGRGFTLIELLLVVSLVLLLMGAVVFSFTNLQKGAELEEGATQVEALLHFARAQSAMLGRRIEVRFDPVATNGQAAFSGSLQVRWESDPLGKPGWFEPFHEADSYVRQISSLVSFDSIRPWEASESPIPSNSGSGTATTSGSPTVASSNARQDDSAIDGAGSIFFYPDGSSDSAEIRIASMDSDEVRLASIRLQGVTGSMRRQLITDERRLLGSEVGEVSETQPRPQERQRPDPSYP